MSNYSYNAMAGTEAAAQRRAEEALPYNAGKAKRIALIKQAAQKRK